MNNYISVLKKYAVFTGRASRKEYWMFILFNVIIAMALGIVSALIGDKNGILGVIYEFAILVPLLAANVRRLHDTNRSGWWILLDLIPIIGWIWGLVLVCLNSDPGDNKYGANPKVAVAAVATPTTPTQI